jgi:hypothetical protein
VTSLPEKLLALHASLDAAGFRHAFGGAIALAYHVENPRGTADIDVNVAADPAHPEALFVGLPAGVAWGEDDIAQVRRDGQCRLRWDRTPLDLFLPQHALHTVVASRAVTVPFAGVEIPILSATDLVIFKALFARTKDWADIEEMLSPEGPHLVDLDEARRWLDEIVGPDDPRLARLDEAQRAATSRAEPSSFRDLTG